jgi:hypothetical protein
MRRMQTVFWIRWKNCEGEGRWIYETEASLAGDGGWLVGIGNLLKSQNQNFLLVSQRMGVWQCLVCVLELDSFIV